MIWGFPAAFWFCTLMLPAAVIFFYRRRSKHLVVPAVQQWLALGRPVEVQSWRRFLRRLLTLLLQLQIIFMLVLAMADPTPDRAARRLVLVIDVGATMQTAAANGTRLDEAKAMALGISGDLPAGGRVVLLKASHVTELAMPPDTASRAARLIPELNALDVESDVAATVLAAAAYMDAEVPTDVVVISDFSGVAPTALQSAWQGPGRLRLIHVGDEHPNAAITAIWSEQEETSDRYTARIQHKGMTNASVRVDLSIDGQRIESQTIQLTGATTTVTFSVPRVAGSYYQIAMDTRDALALDDQAFGLMGSRERVSVMLVTGGNVPLELALRAQPAANIRIVMPSDYTGPLDADVVIADGVTLPNKETGAANFLFIACPDPFDLATIAPVVGASGIEYWMGNHPVMADLDPTSIRFGEAVTLEWSGGSDPASIAVAGQTPLIMEHPLPAGLRSGGGKCVYWLFDLASSDLSRRMSFPLLLWNTIDYLNQSTTRAEDYVLTGQPLRIKSVGRPSITDPAGRMLVSRKGGKSWVVSDTVSQGVYRAAGDRAETFVLNFLSDRGVRALPARDPALQGESSDAVARHGLLWAMLSVRSLLIVACVLMLLDWVLFQRGRLRVA